VQPLRPGCGPGSYLGSRRVGPSAGLDAVFRLRRALPGRPGGRFHGFRRWQIGCAEAFPDAGPEPFSTPAVGPGAGLEPVLGCIGTQTPTQGTNARPLGTRAPGGSSWNGHTSSPELRAGWMLWQWAKASGSRSISSWHWPFHVSSSPVPLGPFDCQFPGAASLAG
jgi:hypothetical protein